jgi:hypothetical protein
MNGRRHRISNVIETCAKKRVEKTNLAHWIGG